MGYIYCITNLINNKQYVGKTTYSVERRWKQHCSDYKKLKCANRPLYKAMNKYGIDNFKIEILEQCERGFISEREQYWIKYLKTYHLGYNATLGGDGSLIFDELEIIQLYNVHKCIKTVASILGCCIDTVSAILKSNNICIEPHYYDSGVINKPKQINQYSLNNEYLQTFDSVQLAAIWLLENNKIKKLNSSVRGHISDVANGKTKSAYKYIWKYV